MGVSRVVPLPRTPDARRTLILAALGTLTLITVSCSSDPFADNDIDCDPVVYQFDNEIWIMTEGVGRRLSNDGVIAANPSLSPDGQTVAFISGPEADLDLYTMDLDGKNLQVIWAGETLQSSADWAPDGSILVFDQVDGDGVLQVYTIRLDGGRPTQITSGSPNGKPRWANEGDTILFLSLRDSDTQEIYSIDRNGTNPINLTNDPARDVLPEMSPNSALIVFSSDRAGEFDIWLMDSDGSNPVRLTDDPNRDTNPTWSSDGRHILFRSDRDPAGIWSMKADGSDQVPILPDGWLADCP